MIPTTYSSRPFRCQSTVHWPGPLDVHFGCVCPMSALPPKADIGTDMCITFDAATPAAWRYSPRSAAPYRGLPRSQRRYAPQSSVGEAFSRKGAFQCILSLSLLSLLVCTFSE